MAGTITHYWDGTTLVVTSDSGTSACNLKGSSGDTGVRGPQGPAGLIYDAEGQVITPVVANPELDGTETDLTGIEIDGVKYAVSAGGGEEVSSIVGVSTGTVTERGDYTITPLTFEMSDGSTFSAEIEAKSGTDGEDGVGTDGKDGIGVEQAEINDSGELVLTYTNGNSVNLGVVVGKDGTDGVNGTNGTNGTDGEDGKDGADGVGVTSITQTTTSTANGGTNIITCTLTDGTTSTFRIKNGSKGADGADGTNGTNGTDGTDGVSVTGITAGTVTTSDDYTVTPITFALSDGTSKTVNVQAQNGASGGTSTPLYRHNIKIYQTSYFEMTFDLYSYSSSADYTVQTAIAAAFGTANYYEYPVLGNVTISSTGTFLLKSFKRSLNTYYAEYMDTINTHATADVTLSNLSISEKITEVE